MTYRLFSHDGSGGFVVEAALVKAGVPFEISVVETDAGEQMAPEFIALNPLHQVPVLILPDGTVMTETAAMAIYLSSACPQAGIAALPGSPAYAQFLRWMVFMSVNLYEGCLRGFYPERYTTDAEGADAVKQASDGHMRRSFEVIEEVLRERQFICGDELTIADVYLAMLAQWGPKSSLKGVASVVSEVAADPVYGSLWKRHGF